MESNRLGQVSAAKRPGSVRSRPCQAGKHAKMQSSAEAPDPFVIKGVREITTAMMIIIGIRRTQLIEIIEIMAIILMLAIILTSHDPTIREISGQPPPWPSVPGYVRRTPGSRRGLYGFGFKA